MRSFFLPQTMPTRWRAWRWLLCFTQSFRDPERRSLSHFQPGVSLGGRYPAGRQGRGRVRTGPGGTCHFCGLLSRTVTWPHNHREPLADGQEEGEMGGCGGERSLEEVLNDNRVEHVLKLLWLLLFLGLEIFFKNNILLRTQVYEAYRCRVLFWNAGFWTRQNWVQVKLLPLNVQPKLRRS